MIYRQLIDSLAAGQTVQVGVIGTGHFATAVVTQSQVIPELDVCVVCDTHIEAAQRAYRRAGLAEDDYVICESRAAAQAALERGQRVIVRDAMILMELPVDVVVESTGVPEASARHAYEAIQHGKHVAMVSKEADVSVGPILKLLADQAGLVYTAVDGDQHGLLLSMIQWARDLGLEVICAGKALDNEVVFDPASGSASLEHHTMAIAEQDRPVLAPQPQTAAPGQIAARRSLLGDFGSIGGYDVVEMTIVVNGSGLKPDIETLHCPVIRIPEIPEVLTVAEDGGILQQRGVVDAVRCLRSPYEAGLGGGVFVVVGCENDYSREILLTKGLIGNSRGTSALIYRPYHLCGVETPVSILVAGLLKQPTAPLDYAPRYDVVAQAAADLKAGDIVGNDHSPLLTALMRPAQPLGEDAPVPFHMASGRRLTADVPAGRVLSRGMIESPANSMLWTLRAQQDQHFLAGN